MIHTWYLLRSMNKTECHACSRYDVPIFHGDIFTEFCANECQQYFTDMNQSTCHKAMLVVSKIYCWKNMGIATTMVDNPFNCIRGDIACVT